MDLFWFPFSLNQFDISASEEDGGAICTDPKIFVAVMIPYLDFLHLKIQIIKIMKKLKPKMRICIV